MKEEIDQSKDEESSRHFSLGELWDLEFKTKINLDIESNVGVEKKLHPITIMSVSDKLTKSRLVCTALIDQCCTRHGLITNDLAEALGCKFKKATRTQSYKTAAGEFESQHKTSIKGGDATLHFNPMNCRCCTQRNVQRGKCRCNIRNNFGTRLDLKSHDPNRTTRVLGL